MQGGIALSQTNSETGTQQIETTNHCRCRKELARAYVPAQEFGDLFRPEVGLTNGTIFPELYQPYKRFNS